MKGIIIILGSPNDEHGNLSDIAISRLNRGLHEYRQHKGYKILCTGGFGEHFNVTNTPHAKYAQNYLLQSGVLRTDILEVVESQNTAEDALLAKPVVEKYGMKSLIIVSSDFHMKRVKYIFNKVFKGFHLTFCGAKSNLTEQKYKVLKNHEERELKKIKKTGLPSF
jgi:uncharacterized SAM-binding protein YcdF (DUF218 family)